MSKLEEAYSIEYGEAVNAEKAYELFWEGFINDKRAFECTDPKCEAQITCVNIDKKRAEMKQTPHFKCYGRHSEECEVIKEFKEIEENKSRRTGRQAIGYIDNKIDLFSFNRPKRDSVIIKTKGKTDIETKKKNKERIEQEYKSNGSRNVTYYSIKPLISKFEKYSSENTLNKHFVNIKISKARDIKISYNKMFVNIKDMEVDKIEKYFRIYYGVGKIYKTKKNERDFVIFLSDGFGNKKTKTIIYISDSTIEKNYMKNKWREELEYLVQEKDNKIIFFVNCKLQQKDDTITLPLFNMDFFDYRILSE